MSKKINNTEKKFTWADLKKVVNRMPADALSRDVTIWTEDERCYTVTNVERLKEDYVDDGDCGCCPKSIMKNGDPEGWKENKDEYGVVYPKGTRIVNAE